MQRPDDTVDKWQTDRQSHQDKRNGQTEILPIEDRVNIRESVFSPTSRRPIDGTEHNVRSQSGERVMKVQHSARSLADKYVANRHDTV